MILKKIALTLILITSTAFSAPFFNIKRLNKAPLELVLKQLSKELSEKLPKEINKFTKLTEIKSNKNSLTFIKTIDLQKAIQINNALKNEKAKVYLKKFLQNNDKNEVCKETIFKYVLSRGASINYTLTDEKSNFLFKYNIDNRLCLQ